jgi:cellulose synthase (UDP-forming)
VVAWLELVLYAFQAWTLSDRHSPPSTTRPTIDVFVCTYDESIDVVRATLTAACVMAARWGPAEVYCLDDGHRREMQALSTELGATWLTRPNNDHAKAGNINNALAHTDGELVLVLDADHVPAPETLERLAGYFADERLALVQTPHSFYNEDSIQHFDKHRNDQSQFFEVVCPGKDHHEAVFWCGTGALLRRAALDEVGGVLVDTVAEDFHTTIAMHAKGWRTAFHREELIRGLAPLDLAGYLLQRDRWARGNMAVLRTTESPLRVRGITGRQRLCYLASLLSYATGPQRAAMLGVLVVSLWSGTLPLHADALTLATIWLPGVLLTLSAGMMLGRGWSKFPESTRQELLTMETYSRAWLGFLRNRRTQFRVTPKDGVALSDRELWKLLRTLAVLSGLLLVGAALRLLELAHVHLLPHLSGIAYPLLLVLALWEGFWCAESIWAVLQRRQRRNRWRFATELPAKVDNRAATVVDIHPDGFALATDQPFAPDDLVSARVDVPSLDGATEQLQLHGLVRSCVHTNTGWRVGIEGVFSAEARRRVYEYCFVTLRAGALETAGDEALRPQLPVRGEPTVAR